MSFDTTQINARHSSQIKVGYVYTTSSYSSISPSLEPSFIRLLPSRSIGLVGLLPGMWLPEDGVGVAAVRDAVAAG